MATNKKRTNPIKKILNAVRPHDVGASWDQAAKVTVVATILATILTVSWWNTEAWQLQKMLVFLAGISLAWVFYIIAMFKRQTHRWEWHPIDLLVVIFGLGAALSTLTSVNWWNSLFGISGWRDQSLLMILGLVGSYFLVAKLFITAADRRLLWWAILGGLTVGLLLQMFQFSGLSIFPGTWHSQSWFSVLTNSPTQLMLIAAFVATALMLIVVGAKELWAQGLGLIGVAVSWVILFYGQYAIGWAMFALGMMLVVLQVARTKMAHPRWLLIAVLLAALGMIAQLTSLADHGGVAKPVEVSLDQRTSIQVSFRTLWHRTVLGSGPATFAEDFVSYRDTAYNKTATWNVRFSQASAAWWQTIATLGLVGTMVLMAILAFGWWLGWTAWKKTGEPLFLAAILGSGFLFVAGWFSTWPLALLIAAWVGIGSARAAVYESSKVKPAKLGLWMTLVGVALPLCAIVLTVPMIRIAMSDMATKHAQNLFSQVQANQTAQNSKLLHSAETWLTRATNWDAHNTTAAVLLANTHVIRLQEEVQNKNTTAASQELQLMNTGLAAAKKAQPNEPAIYETENNLLNLLSGVVADAATRAQANFLFLRQLEPASPIHDVGYGQTLMLERSNLMSSTATANSTKTTALLTQAEAAFADALKKKPGYFQAQYAQAQAFIAAGKYSDALTALPSDGSVTTSQQLALVDQVRGQAYSGLKEDELAVSAYQASIEANNQDPLTYLLLSDFYSQRKDKTKATAILDQGLKALPNDSQLTAAKAAL